MFGRKREETIQKKIVSGLRCITYHEGEDIVIEAKAKTVEDLKQLKEIIDRMITEQIQTKQKKK